MDVNVGSSDQKLRTAGGAVLGILSIATLVGTVPLPSILSPVLGIISLVMIATATVGMCPLYSVLGVSSRSGSSAGHTER